jgi:hypothetical protein
VLGFDSEEQKMTNMGRVRKSVSVLLFTLIATIGFSSSASAATLNVLWYTGGVENFNFDYRPDVLSLAALAPGAPGGNTWNVTFWDAGAQPGGIFDVLVTASPQGGWTTYPNYTALTSAAPTLGDRVMITGQDADYHLMNFPGPTPFNGPQGFLLNAINWAGSGTGMGAVILGHGGLAQSLGLTGFAYSGAATNTVTIPAAYASFPINTNLTSAGLSNWATSAHQAYNVDSSLWTSINTAGACDPNTSTTCTVTFVSAATGGGGITPVPEPASFLLLGTALLGAGVRRWRQGRG